MKSCRLGHRDPALADESDRLLVRHRAGGGERGELADGVADDVVRFVTARTQRREDRERRRDERRLLHGRVEQLVSVAVEAELRQVEPRRLAAAVVHVAGLRHRFGDVAAHARLHRALPREAERDLAHAAISFVQRISALPQVRPAPIPVIRTSCPGRRRPSTAASPSASGIEPDDVLPYL